MSDVVQFGAIVSTLVLCVVTVLSLIGNLLVIVILLKYENLKSFTNCFVLNLALSALVFTSGLPFLAQYHYLDQWVLGDFACKAHVFVLDSGVYSSVLFLTLMTLQRHRVLVHSLPDGGDKCTCFALCLSVCAWVVSFVAALPATLHVKTQPWYDEAHCMYDSIDWQRAAAYQKIVFFFIVFGIMCFCYSRILTTVLNSPSSKRIRTVKLISVTVVVFVLGWAPYNIVILLWTLSHLDPFKDCNWSINLNYANYITQCLAYSHCCLNPVFHAFVGVTFRTHLKVIVQKILPAPQAAHFATPQLPMFGLDSVSVTRLLVALHPLSSGAESAIEGLGR
ncbi:chemokine XC receptor 1-like [Engraulis encrasicolus]|uniref:chemokine XC receptor 1-like n=1 Tax=Engraulis encrasicolus TaxID=184585 RepID=UPI002FD3AE86